MNKHQVITSDMDMAGVLQMLTVFVFSLKPLFCRFFHYLLHQFLSHPDHPYHCTLIMKLSQTQVFYLCLILTIYAIISTFLTFSSSILTLNNQG